MGGETETERELQGVMDLVRPAWVPGHLEDVAGLLAHGAKQGDVAQAMNVTDGMARRLCQEPRVRALVKELREESQLRLQVMQPKALRKLDALMESEDERVSLAAAQDTLDRGGFPRQTRTESRTESWSMSATLTGAEIDGINRRAIDAQRHQADVSEEREDA